MLCKATTHSDIDLCRACEAMLPGISYPCPVCALPRPSATAVCNRCSGPELATDAIYSGYLYGELIRHLLGRFKQDRYLPCGRVLASLMCQIMEQSEPVHYDRIIPMPAAPQQLRLRGFNQAEILARPVAARCGLRPDTDSVVRSDNRLAQKHLRAEDRLLNIRNSFHVQRVVSGMRILIVDDVITTGASVSELARTLKMTGATRVDALSLARTPRS
ncbi:MAG: ComF family protein [Pseudomonadales bacterium]|nr:ComF family protein [Pseudomonadales bacterium]